jgi:UDP-N-acetylmuramyl tripeptide synthase
MSGKPSKLAANEYIAVLAGKLSAAAIKIAGAGLASNLPGKIARRISPCVLPSLSRQCRQGVVAVSGTNGKSTTSGLMSSILRQAGLKIVHNRQGANLVPGITSSLIDAASWAGGVDADYGLFEIDEAALPVVAREVPILAVVVTNLFRDQLDRFGELDTTGKLIAKGIAENSSQAILNADDPNVAQLVPQAKQLFYGIESLAQEGGNGAATFAGGQPATIPQSGTTELSYCADCGGEFTYDLTFYGQLGHYACGKCGRRRPLPDVFAENVRVSPEHSQFTLSYRSEKLSIKLPLPGMFNVYNALAATALAHFLNLPAQAVSEGLTKYQTLFGRSERLQVFGKDTLIQLIKNPAGASQAVAAAASDPKARILIAINDNLADGRDVSWLWDAEFEHFAGHEKTIIVSGQRCYDMALRLKYGGVEEEQIEIVPALEEAVVRAIEKTTPAETLWILPTYTCLLDLQKIMKRLGYALSST